MADGGLPSLGSNMQVGAGLGDAATTMRDRQEQLQYLKPFAPITPADEPGTTMADVDADTSVGLGGEILYGAQRAGESAFQGAGDFLGDRLGVGRETLYGLGDMVGPSDEQEEAQVRQAAAEDRTFAGETADIIAQEAVPTAAPVALAIGGAAVAGPVGAAIGGGAGLVFNWLRMRDETRDRAKLEKAEALYGPDQLTQEKIDAVELDDNDLTKVEYTAAMGAALDYVTPLKVLRRLKPGRAAELGRDLIQRSAAKAAGRKLTGDALTEGTTEVAQMALQEIVFDEELRQRMSEDEVAEVAQWVGEEYGKEAAQSFIAGSAIGGAMGAGSGAYQQKMANAKRANDVKVLAQAGETSGVDIADFENAAKDPERVGQMVEDADRVRAAEARLRMADKELDAYAAQPEESRDPEVMESLTKVRDNAKARYDQTHDEVMPRYGGMKIGEIEQRRSQIEDDIKRQAVERARENDYIVPDDIDPATINSVMEPVEEAKAELSSAQRKLDNTTDDRFRSKYSKQAKKARQKLRAAEINARKTLYGESPKEAEQYLDREAGIRRQRERLFGGEEDPQAVIDKADQVIAERSETGKVKKTRQDARERMSKLYDDLDNAETETQIQEIEAKIAKEQAKLKQPDPLVEAATRAKRDAQRTLGIEPTADEAVDPMAGLPEAEGAPEAEGEVQPAEEVGGEATAEPPTTPDQEAQLAAGAEPGVTQAGVPLPEAPERYFEADPNAVEVPVSDLRPSRARPEGIENAAIKMRDAYEGTGGRRKPISVRPEADGTYTVLDGNSTFANAAQAGWSNIPVRVVTDEQYAAETAPGFGQRTGTRTSVEGRTITARGRESRRQIVEQQAEREGLDVRFEPTDAETVPANDPRRRGLNAGRQYPWRDAIDMVGGDATLEDVEAHLEEMAPDVEYQAAFDADGNLLGFGTNDHPNGVALPQLAQRGTDITTVHNHPLDTPFSPADVAMMHSGRIARSRIVTPSGRFEMQPGAALADMDYQQALELTRGVLDEVQAANPGIEGGRESAARVYQEATLRILDADGVIEYTQPFTNLTPEEEGLINDITDTVFDTRAGGPSQLGDGLRADAGGGAAPLGQEQPAGGERPADAEGQPPQGRREGESVGETKARWKAEQAAAFPTLDDVMTAAHRNNPTLQNMGRQIARQMADAGVTYVRGPIKTRESIGRKIGPGGSKAGDPPGSLGDVIRGTFTAPDNATVEQIIDTLRRNDQGVELVAEDWSVTPAGYADRALVLRMPDGQLAEIQLMPPAMLMAKMGMTPDGNVTRLPFAAGHSLYEIARDTSSSEADKARANREMRQLYASAAALSSPDVQARLRAIDPALLTEADQGVMDALQRGMSGGTEPEPEAAQAVDLRMGEDTLERYGLTGSGPHKTRDIAAALEARQRELHGVIKKGDFSDEAKAKIASWMSEEAAFEITQAEVGADSGAGWYGEKFQRALDAFAAVYPELGRGTTDMGGTVFNTPQEARDYMTSLIAITSDGEKVYTNFKKAAELYAAARTNGVLPTDSQGMRGASMRENARRINELWAGRGPAMKEYLLEEVTVADLNKALRAQGLTPVTKYQAHMRMPRAALAFGPKLGAFYANLSGADGYLTMDRWWSRTFNRYRGTLLDAPSAAGKKRVRQLIADDQGLDHSALPDDVLIVKAGEYAQSYKEKGYKNGTEVERASNTLWKAASENLNDVPFGARDRTFMIDTVKEAQAQLRTQGIDTTVADIQAILWYYEKRLYAEMGARATPDISYEEVARRVVNETIDPDGGPGGPGQGAGGPELRGPDGTAIESADGPGIGSNEIEVAANIDTRPDGGPSAGRARGGSRRLADGSLTALEGAPRIRGHKGPIQELVKVAEDYAARNGIDLVPQGEFVSVDPDRARRIAEAYEAMPHAPQDPAVKAAYADLIEQTRAQYDALADAGYEFFFFAPDSPYGDSPATAMEDIRLNKRMGVFPTDAGFGTNESFDPSDNPMLADTGLQWADEQGNMKPVYANDLFRAVHDAFGHGLEGAGFRADGEENAWQAHIRLFTGPAKGAITTETRGQNSWLNYGPYGEQNQTAAVEDTVFADQKTGLMPEWTWTEGIAPDAPEAGGEVAQGVDEPRPGTPVPLYVARDVVDDGGLRQWAIDNGITDPLPLDDMHMTVTYSRAPVDIADAPAKTNSRTVSVIGEPMLLGSDNDTLVVPLTKGGPTMDHKRYRRAGASHDYGDEYTPHITIKYDATEADLETLRAAPKFTGKITLGPEVQKRLRPGGVPAPDPELVVEPDNPEIAQAVDMPRYIDIGYKESQSAFRSTLKGLKNPGQVTRTWTSWLEDNFFNGFAPIRRLEQAVTGGLATGAESAFKAAEMAVNDTGRNEALMYYGAAKLGAHGEFSIKDGTKGLRQIFDEVAADGGPQALADWMGYMAARRAQDLKARGIATPLSDSDIRDALAKETPVFKQAAKDWKDHNDANIDFLVDTGRISKAQAKAMKDDEHYVPFYRSTQQMADGSSPDFSLDEYLGVQAPGRAGSGAVLKRDPGIKKIVGGDRVAIDNLMLNMIRNSQAMVAAGMRNQAANKTFDLMEMAGLAKPVKAQKVSKKTGKIVRREKPANSVRMWINGREKFVIVNEEGAPLIAALGGLHPQQRGAIENLMINIASIFRQGITLSPAFMIRNAIRGAVSTGLLTSGSNLTASNNFFTGFSEVLRASDATKAFKHMSGMGDYRFGNPDIGFGQDDILIEYGLAPKTIMSRMRGMLDKAEKIGTATELADRVAAFKTMQKSGVRSDEAAYQALTIMNYSRRGNNAAVRMLMPMVPFLNARLQGLSRLAEGSIKKGGALPRKKAMVQLAMNGTLLSMASLALWGMTNADEEDREKYLEEPMYRKLNYHIMYAGDKTIYIPKAFELGAIFSTIPELAMDAVVNDQGDQVVPGLQQIAGQTFLFNAIPAAMLPAIEVMTNYSFFRQGPIEGMRESMLRPRDRTTGASPLAVFVGQKLGLSDAADISPVQIEHYLQGYGGAYYHMMSAASEIAGSELGLIPQTPQGALGDTPVASVAAERALGSMVKATPQQTSKYLGEFYDTKDYIGQIYMSAKTAATNGDVEYARHLLSQVPGLVKARKIMNKIGPKMSDLNAAIRLTRQDRTLSRKQKADRLAPLVKARNALSKQVVDVVRQIEEAQGSTFKAVA